MKYQYHRAILFFSAVVSIGAFQPAVAPQPAMSSSLLRMAFPRVSGSIKRRGVPRSFIMGQERDDIETAEGGDTMRPMVESLLSSTISRAMSTLSNNPASPSDSTTSTTNQQNKSNRNTSNIIDAAIVRATDQISNIPDSPAAAETKPDLDQKKTHEDKRTYLGNPAVTPTALGHALWSEVIQPYRDTVIDATAGNGKDTLVLAEMLFPSDPQDGTDGVIDSEHQPKLISIDIQQRACENTLQLLQDNLNPNIVEKYIEVLHSSHAPMPALPKESVGLICYNLGYLPGADKEAFQTQMMTTIFSLADSALLIRPGGLLSVLSYPGNGWKEHCAVNYFMEGIAMYASKNRGGWTGFVDRIPSDFELEQSHIGLYGGDCEVAQSRDEFTIRDTVRLALERVKADGFGKQTWRVFDHRPLGRPLSPILFTGMRIK